MSAKRSRLFPEVFDDCSHVGRRLSPRDMAIIREMYEREFALNLLEAGGIGLSESCEKVPYSILSTDVPWSPTSDHQVLVSRARQLFGDCTRVVPPEVIR